eukprot:scaffold17305_cov172-Amphora_coffeaeformis.AAC.3
MACSARQMYPLMSDAPKPAPVNCVAAATKVDPTRRPAGAEGQGRISFVAVREARGQNRGKALIVNEESVKLHTDENLWLPQIFYFARRRRVAGKKRDYGTALPDSLIHLLLLGRSVVATPRIPCASVVMS